MSTTWLIVVLVCAVCVLLLALVGARLIEPGRLEAAGRSAAAQHYHQAEQGPSHR